MHGPPAGRLLCHKGQSCLATRGPPREGLCQKAWLDGYSLFQPCRLLLVDSPENPWSWNVLENLLLAGEGCWASTLPDSLLARELRALFPRSARQPSLLQGLQDLRDYLDSAHRPALHEGLQTLLNCAQSHRQPEVVLGGLRCRCCQRLFNPNERITLAKERPHPVHHRLTETG